jgi:ribosomal protein S18 acetylase RimI-like enzyme
MNDLLLNPVYHALLSRDAHLGGGKGLIRFFDEEVSPFAGFPADHRQGFDDLYDQLPAGRKILYANPQLIKEPKGWQLAIEIKGLQFIFPSIASVPKPSVQPIALDKTHVDEMVALATLTKPGPFASRTIEFGHYHGIFDNGQLVAMTGQRLHAGDHSEISAVCTHPDHLGKGYAAALILHQLEIIASHGEKAFLHVRADNNRAIDLYKRLGFGISRPMNFYFMKRK